jgi:hypothetical protein
MFLRAKKGDSPSQTRWGIRSQKYGASLGLSASIIGRHLRLSNLSEFYLPANESAQQISTFYRPQQAQQAQQDPSEMPRSGGFLTDAARWSSWFSFRVGALGFFHLIFVLWLAPALTQESEVAAVELPKGTDFQAAFDGREFRGLRLAIVPQTTLRERRLPLYSTVERPDYDDFSR